MYTHVNIADFLGCCVLPIKSNLVPDTWCDQRSIGFKFADLNFFFKFFQIMKRENRALFA